MLSRPRKGKMGGGVEGVIRPRGKIMESSGVEDLQRQA